MSESAENDKKLPTGSLKIKSVLTKEKPLFPVDKAKANAKSGNGNDIF